MAEELYDEQNEKESPDARKILAQAMGGTWDKDDVGFEKHPSSEAPDVGFAPRPSKEGPDIGFNRTKPDEISDQVLQQAMRGASTDAANKAESNVASSVRPVLSPPPTGTNLPALIKEKAGLSTPINPRDEQGNVKPQYRKSIGSRILGTLGNALVGAASKGTEPAPFHVGPGATNARYSADERARQGRQAGLTSQIEDQQTLDEVNRKAYETNVLAQDRAAQAAERTSKVDTNEATAEKNRAWAPIQEEKNQNQADKIANDSDYKQKLLEVRQQPKNYEQTVLAWALETDPQKKAKLATAMETMRKTEQKKFNYKTGFGVADAIKGGMSAGQAREFDRDPTVIQERQKLGAMRASLAWLPKGSQEAIRVNGEMDKSKQAIQSVFDRIKGGAVQGPRSGGDGAQGKYTQYAINGNQRIGFNPKSKQWEDVKTGKPYQQTAAQ